MLHLMILEIPTDDKNQKINEKTFELKYNDKNIFHKYLRSFCGKFLFTEKESDKKYLIYRENDDMNIKPVEFDLKKNNDDNNIEANNCYIHFLYTLENNLYLLAELPKENEEENGYIILGIFNLFYNQDKDVYESKLIQKILINHEGRNKDYFININMDRDISIQTNDSLIFIQLGKNSSVENIYTLNTNAKELQISKIILAKYEQKFILLSFIKENIFISKLLKNDSNDIEKNCVLNYEQNEKLLKLEDNKANENIEKVIDNCDKINKEQKIEKNSEETLEKI